MIRTRLLTKLAGIVGVVGLAAAALSFTPAHADSAPFFKPDLQLVSQSTGQIGPMMFYYLRLTNNGTGYANNTKVEGYCYSQNFGYYVVTYAGSLAPNESRLVVLTCPKYPDNYGQVNQGLIARATTPYELNFSDNLARMGKTPQIEPKW